MTIRASIRLSERDDRWEPTTIGQALLAAASRWPDDVALIDGAAVSASTRPRCWTFAQLAEQAVTVAQALLLRFAPGDRVAVWSTNHPEWILLQFGAALADLVLVTVNPAYRDSEVAYVLKQSQAVGVFVEPVVRSRDLLAAAQAVAEDLPLLHTIISMDGWEQFLGEARSSTVLPDVSPSSAAQIQYTSGTTGFPKGALLSHDGLVLNGRVYAETIGAVPGDVWINPMPLFHTAGCGLVTLGALQTGGCHVLPAGFDADDMLNLFEQHSGTVMLSVPTMLIRMLEAQATQPRDLSSWRLTTLGGAPVPVELVRRAQRELAVSVGIGFGQTESSPYITHTVVDDPHPAWFETIGAPLPEVDVKVVDTDTGETVATGVEGEICTRGRCVMIGYFNDQEATSRALDPDGWLHTGDVGVMDELGYLRIRGRMKDLIIRGGENIYPREVEDVLSRHPAVAGVAVVGLPDEHWGEAVGAFIETHPDTEIDLAALRDMCQAHLAAYKVPRVWSVVGSLPLTASGKIQKFVLRDQWVAEHASAARTSTR